MVWLILRLEDAAFCILGVYAYYILGASWWFFNLAFLVPDLSLLGYTFNDRIGASLYNFVHNYILACVIIAAGFYLHHELTTASGIVLFTHIALDRVFGYGVKYPTGFEHSHIQRY